MSDDELDITDSSYCDEDGNSSVSNDQVWVSRKKVMGKRKGNLNDTETDKSNSDGRESDSDSDFLRQNQVNLIEVVCSGNRNRINETIRGWSRLINEAASEATVQVLYQLINFVTQVSGFNNNCFASSDVNRRITTSVINETFRSSNQESGSTTGQTVRARWKNKHFEKKCLNFWVSFVTKINSSVLLTSILPVLIRWIVSLSKSNYGQIRWGGVVSGYFLGDGILAKLSILKTDCERYRAQVSTEKMRSNRSVSNHEIAETLEKKLSEYRTEEDKCKQFLIDIYESVLSVRWADTSASIRIETFNTLMRWFEHEMGTLIIQRPKNINFLHHGLCDRENRVRESCVRLLLNHAKSAQEWNELFKDITEPSSNLILRIIDLPCDQCHSVALLGTELLSRLISFENVITDAHIESIFRVLWGFPNAMVLNKLPLESQNMFLRLYENFGKLINSSIFVDSIITTESITYSTDKKRKKSKSNKPNIVPLSTVGGDTSKLYSLIELLVEFGDEENHQMCSSNVVSAFWKLAPCLTNVTHLVELIVYGEDKNFTSTDSELFPTTIRHCLWALSLLLSSFIHFKLTYDYSSNPFPIPESLSKDSFHQKFKETVHCIISHIPKLISLAKGEGTHTLECTCVLTFHSIKYLHLLGDQQQYNIHKIMVTLLSVLKLPITSSVAFDSLLTSIASILYGMDNEEAENELCGYAGELVTEAIDSWSNVQNIDFDNPLEVKKKYRQRFELTLHKLTSLMQTIDVNLFEERLSSFIEILGVILEYRSIDNHGYFDESRPNPLIVCYILSYLIIVFYSTWSYLEATLTDVEDIAKKTSYFTQQEKQVDTELDNNNVFGSDKRKRISDALEYSGSILTRKRRRKHLSSLETNNTAIVAEAVLETIINWMHSSVIVLLNDSNDWVSLVATAFVTDCEKIYSVFYKLSNNTTDDERRDEMNPLPSLLSRSTAELPTDLHKVEGILHKYLTLLEITESELKIINSYFRRSIKMLELATPAQTAGYNQVLTSNDATQCSHCLMIVESIKSVFSKQIMKNEHWNDDEIFFDHPFLELRNIKLTELMTFLSTQSVFTQSVLPSISLYQLSLNNFSELQVKTEHFLCVYLRERCQAAWKVIYNMIYLFKNELNSAPGKYKMIMSKFSSTLQPIDIIESVQGLCALLNKLPKILNTQAQLKRAVVSLRSFVARSKEINDNNRYMGFLSEIESMVDSELPGISLILGKDERVIAE